MKKILLILLLGLSGNAFSQAIVLTKPMKGDIWPAYSKQRIEWSSTNIDNIKIESSLDSGKTWKTEISSYPASAGYYDWDVPNKVSDSCFIRVSDAIDVTKSSSNYPGSPFKIPAAGISLDAMPGSVTRGTIVPITWLSSGIRKVNLLVSYNNKQKFIKIADTIPANQFYFNWLVPDSVSSTCFIAIQDASVLSLSDTLKQAFSTVSPANINVAKFKGGFYDGHSSSANIKRKLALLSFNNADSVYGSTTQSIKWSYQNIERIHIYFSSDSGLNWKAIARDITASASSFDWKTGNIPTNKALIKIMDAADSSLIAISNRPFVIRNKTLKITSPDTSAVVYKNTVLPISWNSGGVSYIRIKLRYDNKDSIVVDSLPAGNETFNLIIKPQTKDTIQLVLIDINDSSFTDTIQRIVLRQLKTTNNAKYKGGAFDGHASKTNQKSTLQLVSPNGKEILSVRNNYNISWRTANIERIKLELSIDSGKTWSLISDQLTASSGNYIWKTPNTASSKCLLKISDANDSTIYDKSDSLFALIPKTLINTTDTANWKKETAKCIEWSPRGVDTIRIYYKTSYNGTWKLLKDSLPATNEACNWILPASLPDSLWVRLEDLTDPTINTVNSYLIRAGIATANIAPTKYKGGAFDGHAQKSNINKIIIRKPDANEVLIGGSKYSISWTTVNLEDSVVIQYTIDSGATWITVARTIATSGVYEWTVPSTIQGKSVGNFFEGLVRNNSIDGIRSNVTTTVINSSKCRIRALDISAGDQLVGISNNTFSIVGSNNIPLADTIRFIQSPPLTSGQSAAILQASASSGRAVSFYISNGASKASITGNQITPLAAGKITVAAFIAPDPTYLKTDTVYQTICINPAKPILSYTGKTILCSKDTITINAPTGNTQYLWSTGATSASVKIYAAGELSVKIGEDGCYSSSSDTLKFTETNVNATITSIGNTSFCTGDSVILNSNSANGNQWLLNGTAITGATGNKYSAKTSGSYGLMVTSNGCSTNAISAITVTVNTYPAKPGISQISGDLVSSGSYGYQWYNSTGAINGATNATYRPNTNGYYRLQVSNMGCITMSDPYYYMITGIMNTNSGSDHYKILPNPVWDILQIDATNNQNKIMLQLIDANGHLILSKTFNTRGQINMIPLASGIYTIVLTDTKTKKQESQQIIKQ